MDTWIALLRGINVGGRNKLAMASLRSIMEGLGLEKVRTYIQSGNVVFRAEIKDAPALARQIANRIESEHGFRPNVLLMRSQTLREALDTNPFPDAESDPKTLHFYFLSETAAQADVEALEAKRASTERFQLMDSVFYLYAPEGIGRSKLAASAERHLGVATTARNLRSVRKLVEIASGDE